MTQATADATSGSPKLLLAAAAYLAVGVLVWIALGPTFHWYNPLSYLWLAGTTALWPIALVWWLGSALVRIAIGAALCVAAFLLVRWRLRRRA